MNEREIIEGCRRGDRIAQRLLFEKTSATIYRLCLKLTGNADDAFDLAQDTYVRAFGGIVEFRGTSRVTTWLYRVAYNEFLQLHRRRRLEAGQRLTIEPSGDNDTPTQSVDRRIDVEAAMLALGAEERAILLLRYQDGLDYAQIADVLGCAGGTVASRLNRARNRLREGLKESYADREETETVDHPKGADVGSTQRRRRRRRGRFES